MAQMIFDKELFCDFICFIDSAFAIGGTPCLKRINIRKDFLFLVSRHAFGDHIFWLPFDPNSHTSHKQNYNSYLLYC